MNKLEEKTLNICGIKKQKDDYYDIKTGLKFKTKEFNRVYEIDDKENYIKRSLEIYNEEIMVCDGYDDNYISFKINDYDFSINIGSYACDEKDVTIRCVIANENSDIVIRDEDDLDFLNIVGYIFLNPYGETPIANISANPNLDCDVKGLIKEILGNLIMANKMSDLIINNVDKIEYVLNEFLTECDAKKIDILKSRYNGCSQFLKQLEKEKKEIGKTIQKVKEKQFNLKSILPTNNK